IHDSIDLFLFASMCPFRITQTFNSSARPALVNVYLSLFSLNLSNAMWQKITEFFTTLQPKDWLTLAASLSAFVVSILSFRQKSAESRLALRKQLTDLLEKLTDLNTEVAKFRANKKDYPPNYPGLLNDQRRFLARQAVFIAGQIAQLVSPYEYLVLAGSFDDINDWSQSEHYFHLAIATASNPLDRGIAIGGYGRYLYGHGRVDDARKQYSSAIQCFQGDSDRIRVFRADTYERWAGHEREWSGPAEANRYLE